jgi:hypothetical protein
VELEPHRQRRNLIAVSLALIVFEIAGGAVKNISFLNVGITLADAELVVSLSYLALVYLLWRYWLYVKPEHVRFRGLVDQTIRSSKMYQELINPLITQFKDKSGVAYAEGWQEFAEEDTKKEFVPIPVEASIQSSLFTRKLVIRVENARGDYNPDHESCGISLLRYEAIRLRAWVSVVAGDKAFSDLFAPYLVAFFAVGALWYRVIHA